MYPSYIYYTIDSYQWRITVERGNVIRISIDNCILKRDSRIQIYDGYDSASGVLATIETDNIPTDAIVSTTNIVLLEFQINTFSESKFKLIWDQVPNDILDKSANGTNTLNCTKNSVYTIDKTEVLKMRSPGWPEGYDGNIYCQWTFLPASMGYHVALTFLTIDLEQVPGCLADFVRVGNSNSMENFNQSTRMCSLNQVSRRLRHHGTPNLQLIFQSDYAQNRTGFESAVLLDCGGTIDSATGIINNNMTTRPSNASSFWLSETCTWNVNVRRGRTIKFEFDHLNLEKAPDGSCNSYLLIRNGPHDDSPFLGDGKYCGSNSNYIPQTSSHQATVQYFRGRLFQKKEFSLKFQQTEHDCGGFITIDYNTNSTIITTPNYPNIPSAHIECIWRITAPGGELLRIDFLERFDLTSTPNCVSEYLEILEGSTSNAPLIGKYCSKMPLPIILSTNMARLHYFTDVSVPRNGFKLKVSFVRCGKGIVSNKGFITSPGYPGQGAYPTSSTCDYHVTGATGTVFNLTITDLDLPTADNCSLVDHIEIYSIARGVEPMLLTTICGDTIPNQIMTLTSIVLIRFKTTATNSLYRGYRISFASTADTCGGTITASTGIIVSPGYPVSREYMRACEWFINVQKGRRIKVEILDYDVLPSVPLPRSGNPNLGVGFNQRLMFYNDYYESRIIVLSSLNDTTQPIYSTDNKMAIQSIIRSNVGHRGFKLRYSSDEPTICEGNFDDTTGMFQTPENTTSFYCEIVRNSHEPFIASRPDRATLSIKMTQRAVLTNRTTCFPNGFIGVSVFYDQDRRVLHSTCPPKYSNIASPFLNTRIGLKSSQYKFVFDYKIHACGGIFQIDTNSRITQPEFDLDYGELDCAWKFTSKSDLSLQMIITSTALNCETDYINIYNGPSPSHPRAGRICGDAVNNQTIEIRSQNTFIEYHSDQFQRTNRFDIRFTTSDGICGGTLAAPNFIFSSPKNGTKYPFNSHCEWILRAQNGFHIGLYFPQRFMLESSDGCKKDYLEVFDKVNDSWVSLNRFCGRELPHFVNSTGRYMKVVFHSDDTVDGDGFTASWNENCGGVFKATNRMQTIPSPRYPERYPKNLYCNYSIQAPEDIQSVNVRFLKFELEETSRSCNFDNVTIYKAIPFSFITQMEEIGTYCWHDSVTSFRSLKRIDIVFRTDAFIERSGFLFEYGTDTCGGVITEPTSISTVSDESNQKYLSLTTCYWNITAPANKRIVIRFELFDLEKVGGCHLDYVDVYEGPIPVPEKRKAKLCGNLTEHAPTININSNEALVKFATDSSIEEKGFSALIYFVKNCNEHIRLDEHQRTYTLNKLTDSYESFLNCEYVVSAPKGYVVRAKFNQFHVSPCEASSNKTCGCDQLTIRDGGGPLAELLGKFRNVLFRLFFC